MTARDGTLELELVDRQQDDALYQAYRASQLRRYGYLYEQAVNVPSIRTCLRNLAQAMRRHDAHA